MIHNEDVTDEPVRRRPRRRRGPPPAERRRPSATATPSSTAERRPPITCSPCCCCCCCCYYCCYKKRNKRTPIQSRFSISAGRRFRLFFLFRPFLFVFAVLRTRHWLLPPSSAPSTAPPQTVTRYARPITQPGQ